MVVMLPVVVVLALLAFTVFAGHEGVLNAREHPEPHHDEDRDYPWGHGDTPLRVPQGRSPQYPRRRLCNTPSMALNRAREYPDTAPA